MTARQQQIINNQVELERMKKTLGIYPTMRIERTGFKPIGTSNLRSLNENLIKKR